MADRIGVINKGELILVEEKEELMRKLGTKQLTLELQCPLSEIPEALSGHNLALNNGGSELTFTYDTSAENTGITPLLNDLRDAGLRLKDLHTKETSLEEIFVSLVSDRQ